ncbi:hypothetical protein [Microvirga sp. TS319]|uniref:hypothetical protein n=1 Tax=Microvirga sp. TS319 TaxID=3241165 RepID=UPI00351A3228
MIALPLSKSAIATPLALPLFLLLTAVAAFAPTLAHAGPCSATIDQLQAVVDSRIDTTAGTGGMARESAEVTDHRQPTPESIARAEKELGEGTGYGQALTLLGQARQADQAGDEATCGKLVDAARGALTR